MILYNESLEARVKILLLTQAHLRDDTTKLIFYTHAMELGLNDINPKSMALFLSNQNLYEYAKKISRGELSSYESITRCRRRLQEQHEELRGEKYEERQKKAKQVRMEMSHA